MKKYCLYRHIAPNGKVYIGITCQKPTSRWQGGNGYKGNSYFSRAIKKYGWDNFIHEILYDDLTEEDAKRLEIEYIAKYKSNIRKYGFNISSGGESKKGTTISEYQKQRIREGTKNRIITEETRRKLSASTTKNWKKPGFVEHMRDINKGEKNPQFGKVRTEEEKIMRGARRILQYDMSGNLINEYISIHDAHEKSGVSRDCISKCCRGIYKQACGYIWEFKK